LKQSVEVIADSIGPNGKRVTTIVANHMRIIHAELLRHRLFSFSVASSRAIPYAKQMEQVKNDPARPVLWPAAHKGMQGTELIDTENASIEIKNDDETIYLTPYEATELQWSGARYAAIGAANYLSEYGLSKQLTNRLLEPWVMTRAVITATNWDNFFRLRHPHHIIPKEIMDTHPALKNENMRWDGDEGHTENGIEWINKVDLNFPAEYNIQDLAIKMKKALDDSTPTELEEGQWHLPFVDISEDIPSGDRASYETLIKISAARSARTSYNKERGKTVEDDLKLADMLMNDHHWSPFEHQARAIPSDFETDCEEGTGHSNINFPTIPEGMQMRVNPDLTSELWSRNFQGFVQARALMDSK
jgi:thymidylate synthase ThyX